MIFEHSRYQVYLKCLTFYGGRYHKEWIYVLTWLMYAISFVVFVAWTFNLFCLLLMKNMIYPKILILLRRYGMCGIFELDPTRTLFVTPNIFGILIFFLSTPIIWIRYSKNCIFLFRIPNWIIWITKVKFELQMWKKWKKSNEK